MHLKNRVLLFVFLTLTLISCTSTKKIVNSTKEDAVKTLLQDSSLQQAHVGLMVYNLNTKQSLYEWQHNKLFLPASNVKIATCYAAMIGLADSLVGLEYATDDDFYTVRFTADPTLLQAEFKQQPILNFFKQHADYITVVPSNFKTSFWGNGWPWNDFDAGYMPQRSAAPVNSNLVGFSFKNKQIEVFPELFKDSLQIFHHYRENDQFAIQRSFTGNNFSLIAANRKFANVNIPFDVSLEHEQLATKIIAQHIGRDLLFADVVPENIQWKKLYSQPTDSLLKMMMHRSDNFYAEQTLLMLAQKWFGEMNEQKVVDSLLKTSFKDLSVKPRWVDGSGLSRYNLFSPAALVEILNKMYQQISWNRITTIFPTGNKGTLTNYYQKLSNRIFAKTGTLNGQVALSGFLITAKNQTFIFSVLVNNHQSTATAVRRAVEQFLITVAENN